MRGYLGTMKINPLGRDIVDRLRDGPLRNHLTLEAADEIERLRSELASLSEERRDHQKG